MHQYVGAAKHFVPLYWWCMQTLKKNLIKVLLEVSFPLPNGVTSEFHQYIWNLAQA
jgi:hypothetical protein